MEWLTRADEITGVAGESIPTRNEAELYRIENDDVREPIC